MICASETSRARARRSSASKHVGDRLVFAGTSFSPSGLRGRAISQVSCARSSTTNGPEDVPTTGSPSSTMAVMSTCPSLLRASIIRADFGSDSKSLKKSCVIAQRVMLVVIALYQPPPGALFIVIGHIRSCRLDIFA